MPLPNFLIIGETKCGTTSMYDNLIQHPQILPTVGNGNDMIVDASVPLGVKELRFFDRNYHRGWDWYKSCFPKCPEGCITGEATPMYLSRPTALHRIQSVMPDIKIVVMAREPSQRLLSHYNHIRKIDKVWREKYPTIEDFWNKASDQDSHIITKGIYWQSFCSLVFYFSQKQLKLIISEELFSNPDKVLKKTFDFLEVDSSVKIDAAHSRKNQYENKIPQEIRDFYEPHNQILREMSDRKELWR